MTKQSFHFERIQVITWLILIVAGIIVTISVDLFWGLLPILVAQLLPRSLKRLPFAQANTPARPPA